MSAVTDNDLKELKDLTNSKFKQTNEKIDNRYQLLDSKLNDIKVEIATIKSHVKGLDKRLDNLDFIARSLVGGTILALLLGLTKFLYPNLLGYS